MNIVWYKRAEKDLFSVFTYVANDSITIAEKEVNRLIESISNLETCPSMGRPGRIAGTRELIVSPYIIAYRIKFRKIQILRILHSARKWPEKL